MGVLAMLYVGLGYHNGNSRMDKDGDLAILDAEIHH